MKSSTKTALIVVLAVVAAGGALAAGYGLSNTFHGWVDDNVLHKDTAYYPKGCVKNDDGTITVKTSFAHTDKSSIPYTGGGTYYTIPDFEVAEYVNSNGCIRVVNSLFSNGEMRGVMLMSQDSTVYLDLLAEQQDVHAVDVKFYSDYDEGLAKEKGAFFYAPYANVEDVDPVFTAKGKADDSIEITVTYVPKGAKYTGDKKAKKSTQSEATTSSAAAN